MAPNEITSSPEPLARGLYLVATPIGNAQDITLRAIEVLRSCDRIYCEDTRVSKPFLSRFEVTTPLDIYQEHNAGAVRPKILKQLSDGARIALISDAGTPLVSDPGYKLVDEAIEQGTRIFPLPGASAVLAALQASGLPSDRFLFAGFLPPRTEARKRELDKLSDVGATLIFFESAKRLLAALKDIEEVMGPRRVAVARELTKKFEEFVRGSPASVRAELESRAAIKGEVTLVIDRLRTEDLSDEVRWTIADAALRERLAEVSVKDAVAEIAVRFALPRRQVYARALAVRDEEK